MAASVKPFSDRERVDVVVDEDRQAKCFLHDLRELHIAPAKERRVESAGAGVKDTGDTEPDAQQRRVARPLAHPAVNYADQHVDCVCRRRVELLLIALDELSLEIHSNPDEIAPVQP